MKMLTRFLNRAQLALCEIKARGGGGRRGAIKQTLLLGVSAYVLGKNRVLRNIECTLYFTFFSKRIIERLIPA